MYVYETYTYEVTTVRYVPRPYSVNMAVWIYVVNG